jgi:hypothetical protein
MARQAKNAPDAPLMSSFEGAVSVQDNPIMFEEM